MCASLELAISYVYYFVAFGIKKKKEKNKDRSTTDVL